MQMTEKPLPERLRALEGVGFWNAMDNAGYKVERTRWIGPAIVAFAVVMAAVMLGVM